MMETISPALSYIPVDDICILIPYFNPSNYKTKLENFHEFIAPIIACKQNYLVIECSSEGKHFEIPDEFNVIRVTSDSVLWQKECLLNIGLKNIPEKCTKFVWTDCDIMFSNGDWLAQTSELLNNYFVAQPFEKAIRLPKDHKSYHGQGIVYNGFAKIYDLFPEIHMCDDFEKHGHTGFVWAARKSVFLEIGLYDACLSGIADHVMAHAFTGSLDSLCFKTMFLENKLHFLHFAKWASEVYSRVNGHVGYCSGTILHLWHGDIKNRKYLANSHYLANNNFDPSIHLRKNEYGCWEICKEGVDLSTWTKAFLEIRSED